MAVPMDDFEPLAQPHENTDQAAVGVNAAMAPCSGSDLRRAPSATEGGERDGHRQMRTLVVQYTHFVWRSLRRLGVPEADCDDGCQRVWLVIAQKLGEIEADKMRSYIFSVVVRVAAELRRDVARHRHDELDERGFGSVGLDAESSLDQQRRRELLDRVLLALSFELRTVFVLFEIEGMSSPEIAEAIGVSRGTVASRLRLAREAFQRSLQRHRARAHGRSRRHAVSLLSGGSVMKDPQRILDAGDNALEMDLLRAARAERAPDHVIARALESAQPAASGSVPTADVSLAQASSGLATPAAIPVGGALGALLASSAVIAVVAQFVLHDASPPALVATTRRPAQSLSAAIAKPALPPTPSELPLAPARAASKRSAVGAARAPLKRAHREPRRPHRLEPPASNLRDELALVAEAARTLRQNDADAALRQLDKYEERFPQGALGREVQLLRQRAERARLLQHTPPQPLRR